MAVRPARERVRLATGLAADLPEVLAVVMDAAWLAAAHDRQTAPLPCFLICVAEKRLRERGCWHEAHTRVARGEIDVEVAPASVAAAVVVVGVVGSGAVEGRRSSVSHATWVPFFRAA